eukprot:COSAG01_NODE_3881_length_5591_cov_101.856154_4_plen_62_part_00
MPDEEISFLALVPPPNDGVARLVVARLRCVAGAMVCWHQLHRARANVHLLLSVLCSEQTDV